jgi:putrescine transport system permease protein
MNQGRNLFRTLVLILGFAFLYIPIVSLIVYSFNSRAVTVWGFYDVVRELLKTTRS